MRGDDIVLNGTNECFIADVYHGGRQLLRCVISLSGSAGDLDGCSPSLPGY